MQLAYYRRRMSALQDALARARARAALETTRTAVPGTPASMITSPGGGGGGGAGRGAGPRVAPLSPLLLPHRASTPPELVMTSAALPVSGTVAGCSGGAGKSCGTIGTGDSETVSDAGGDAGSLGLSSGKGASVGGSSAAGSVSGGSGKPRGKLSEAEEKRAQEALEDELQHMVTALKERSWSLNQRLKDDNKVWPRRARRRVVVVSFHAV